MKRIAFFIIAFAISLSVNAQDYQKLWTEFDENIENLLPESAGKVLDKIENQAVKDRNDVQLLKTVVKRCEILSLTDENPKDTVIGFCKSYIPKLSKASQVILNVEIAKYNHNFDEILKYQDDEFIKSVSMEEYADDFDIELEPTLYDYVMHCLIDNYSYSKIETELYEKLLAFDLKNNFTKAYYNNRINQLNYANEKNYDDFSKLAAECPDNELVAKIKIKQIEYLAYVSNEYVKAKQLCEETMELLEENHPLYNQCVEFLNSLTRKSVAVQLNKVCVEGQAIPVGLTYRNTTAAKYKLYKVSADDFTQIYRLDNEELIDALSGKQLVVENTVKLPAETDYDEHSSLIALPALINGQYILVFSNNDSFKNIKDLVFAPFQVSSLSYFTLDTDNAMNVYVVDRETGEPMSNVKAQFLKRDYNYKTKKHEYTAIGETVSDKNGFLVAPFDYSRGYFFIHLYDKNDTLVANNYESFSRNSLGDNVNIRTDIFTDRAIYRPGQTVQFKGIVIRETKKHKELLPDYDAVVNFYDPMHQVVDSLRVKSDEFGAFSGSFVIPTDRMRGNYQINVNNTGGTIFKVENYKRPTFEVTFESPATEYRVGDSVRISGKVAALSGFGLDNVQYKYVVTRKTAFPFRLWYLTPHYIADETVSTGENITSSDGTFNFDFQLSPSEYVEVCKMPRYTYEVKVEATNKQGETQAATYNIFATYNKYVIAIETEANPSNDIPSIDIRDFKDLAVSVSNINGTPASTKIEYKIFKINDLDRYTKDLGKFDRQLLSDQLLKAYFPKFDYYAKENDQKELVYQGVIDVNGKSELLPENAKFSPARYIVELRSVDDTLSIFSEKYVVFDTKSKKTPYKSMCWTNIDKKTAQPGETVNYYVGSSEKNVSALVIVKRGKTILKSERISLNNNVVKVSYKVREEDRGCLDFQVAMEKYNTEIQYIDYVEVPFDNMKLDIVLNTERNKVLPGSEETWSVTVKDYKNNPVQSSLMAVMYDASLDNFVKHQWDFRTKPNQHLSSSIKSDKSFETLIKHQPFNLARFYYSESPVFSSVALLPSLYYTKGRTAVADYLYYSVADSKNENESISVPSTESHINPPAKIRKDFNETALFYPDLRTDENGDVTFNFTMPDALTRWNFRILAYNKDLSVGNFEKSIVTQQPLMIMADMPRFVYDEDTLWIAANVINLSDDALSPTVKLEIFDEDNNPIKLILSDNNMNISEIPAGRSQSVRWKVAMQKGVNALTFRFSAITKGFSDAEQHLLPVLSTDIFMTQTYSLTVDAKTLKEYEFNISNEGERNHDIKLNFNANPVFYVIQALPYLAESDEKYAASAFYRYFTNKMAQRIVNGNSNIKEMLTEHDGDTLSELQKNEEVKAILLKETPWVLDAKNEAQQRANISRLFDTEAIDKNITSALDILEKKQTLNGGWPWIDGMPESEYITQHILCGLGRLGDKSEMTEKAFHFIENEVVERYNKLDTQKKKKDAICGFITMENLHAMSYFPYETSEKFEEAKTFYINKLRTDWRRYNVEEQAYIALILDRNNFHDIPKLIIKSLRERAIKNELGMYWRNLNVESQARILEAFNEIEPKTEETDAMRLWILTQKRTNMWENERASVEAIFAIMNRGTDWTVEDARASMIVGDDSVKVFVDNQSNHVVWGGLYRQYFVPVDKVQKHSDAMKIKREIIMPENIKVGDKVTVKITFENSQDMEFVYLKDLRGACFEPTEQLSRYHWDNGLWYYQSTTDVSMEYFFEYLPKGKHSVSYELYVTKDGSFSAGHSMIQCQYAPEFGAYSEGSRISVNL